MNSQFNYYAEGITFATNISIGKIGAVILTDVTEAVDMSTMDVMPGMEGMEGVPGMDGATKVRDPIMSNWFFVGGITALTLGVSIALGLLLAKRKIKKGYGLYED